MVFHALRATATTWLYEAGADPKTVARMLGHTSIAVGANVYARGTEAARRAAADRMGAVLASGTDEVATVVPLRARAG